MINVSSLSIISGFLINSGGTPAIRYVSNAGIRLVLPNLGENLC